MKKSSPQQPMAMRTIFGWAILGRYKPDPELPLSQPTLVGHTAATLSSDDLLKCFWETEEVYAPTTCLIPEEQIAIQHFQANHSYLPTGRYQVTLPRNQNFPPLGESRQQAVKRYHSNEYSTVRKGTWRNFQDVIQEYLMLGHAEPVPSTELTQPVCSIYYLPMHAVVKKSSSTTKLRVVFDASAKTSTGQSLNDTVLVGPTLYSSLTDILIHFRSYSVVISSDISKMYRAVELHPSDHDLHQFVWRPEQTSQLQNFSIRSCSGFQQTATDFGHEYPLASPHVQTYFYVDDCLAGADTPHEAAQLQQQLRALLLRGGFDLCKWRSSSTTVMDSIPKELHEPSQVKYLTEEDIAQPQKALGMFWDAHKDILFISVGKITNQESRKGNQSGINETDTGFGHCPDFQCPRMAISFNNSDEDSVPSALGIEA